jgi:HAAS
VRTAIADPVEDYLDGLSRALSGPRRRKADLLAEARDSLVDATEAYEADGLSRYDAQRAAVDEFGKLAEVVPGYKTELGIAQGRRTAVLLCAVLFAQPIVWHEGTWPWTQEPPQHDTFVGFLDALVMTAGTLSIAGSVLALVATGLGLRYPAVRDRVTRMTALFALASCVAVGITAICLASFGGEQHGSTAAALAVVGTFVVGPLLFVGRSATRTLRLA